MHIAAERSLMAKLAQKLPHAGMVLQIPGRQVRWQPLDLERPRGRACRERSLQNEPKRGGITLCSHPQPVVEVALRPEVLRRDEDAPAGSERPRKSDGPVGYAAVERNAHACRMALVQKEVLLQREAGRQVGTDHERVLFRSQNYARTTCVRGSVTQVGSSARYPSLE